MKDVGQTAGAGADVVAGAGETVTGTVREVCEEGAQKCSEWKRSYEHPVSFFRYLKYPSRTFH